MQLIIIAALHAISLGAAVVKVRKEGINKKERGADTEKVKVIKLNDNNSK